MTSTVQQAPTQPTSSAVEPAGQVRAMIERAAPALRASAASSEAARTLAPEAMNALVDAGVVRAFLPASYGGADLGPVHGVRLFEELATVDSAGAWVGMLAAAGSWLTMLLPERGAAELLADPHAVVTGSLFPPMAAERVKGGYMIGGRTSFASGCGNSTWLQFQAVIMENGAPVMAANGMPAAVLAHVPRADATIIDNWDTLGMRGTGSHDFAVEGVFVPDHLSWPMGPVVVANPACAGPLARMGVWWFSPLVASIALGVAQSAIAELLELAATKVPNYTRATLADRPAVQDHVARARATVDAARSYLYGSLADGRDYVESAPRLDVEHGLPLALAASYAIESACQAVQMVHACAGTSGIRAGQRFERHFRDVHTISQHAFASPARFESAGKLLLGRESDWPFYYL
jgi:alkylation response protein AidB-like acyl-CoA dehydrogenase